MSVNEERMFILKMLEEGKITSDDAAKLIAALDTKEKTEEDKANTESNESRTHGYRGPHRHHHNHHQNFNPASANFQEEIFKMRDKINGWKKEFKSNYDQKDFDKTIEEFSSKAESFGKNFASTTAGAVDKVMEFVGSFVDTNSFNIFGSFETVEKRYEVDAIEGLNIDVQAANGSIEIKKHAEEKIVFIAKIKAPAGNAENIVAFENNGQSVITKLSNTGTVSVSWVIFIPQTKLGYLKLDTKNAKITLEDIQASTIEAETKNAYIDFMGVKGDKLKLSTKNAKVLLSYVDSKEIYAETKNAFVELKNIKASEIDVSTANARVVAENIQPTEGVEEMNIKLKTSNGGIKVNMNDFTQTGYNVDAKTSNGGINLLIPGLVYKNLDRKSIGASDIQAETDGFEVATNKVIIKAETSNGYIEIMK